MPKNIILCLDGTNNKFSDNLTNVVRTYSVIDKSKQACYYDPGVGTMADITVYGGIKKTYFRLIGLAFGYGLDRNVIEAYKFLMYNFEEGDRVFIFGFSRGAYTARVLAALVYAVGLIDRGNEAHIPYAYEMYSKRKVRFDLLARFKSRFSTRDCPIHFLGIWDSVSSVGNLWSMRNYPYTSALPNVGIIRHAVAIDERRAFYQNNEVTNQGDVVQKWFAGVHSDVGGGFPELESSLAKIPLLWILNEAEKSGLSINPLKKKRYITDHLPNRYVAPDPLGPTHKNAWPWFIAEFIPRRNITSYKPRIVKWYVPFFRKRKIDPNHLIDASVEQRIKDLGYKPTNLPQNPNYDPTSL